MSNLILENWHGKKRKLPGIDSISYPDGRVTILNFCSLYDSATKKRELFCAPLCDTNIESIEKYNAAYWTVVDEWASIPYMGGKIYGGDGAMGNEGFIAYADAEDNLVWGMFFESTNPIKNLEIKGSTLVAINEHDELQLEINLDNLSEIKVVVVEN